MRNRCGRLAVILLAVVVVVGLLPTIVFADASRPQKPSFSVCRVFLSFESVDHDKPITQQYDMLVAEDEELSSYNAIIETQKPGFLLNPRLSDAFWQTGPGAGIVSKGPDSETIIWGDTNAEANKPAKTLTLYYERTTVTVSFYHDFSAEPLTLSGKYGALLFNDENPEIQSLLHPESTPEQVFKGWYLLEADKPAVVQKDHPENGWRVDDPQVSTYLATFPAVDSALYAWWEERRAPPGSGADEVPENDDVLTDDPSAESPTEDSAQKEAQQGGSSSANEGQGIATQAAAPASPEAPTEGPATVVLSDPQTPLAAFGPIDIPLIASPGEAAFSVATLLFTGIGLGASTVLTLNFMLRRHARFVSEPNKNDVFVSGGFLLRAGALGLGLIQLVTCMSTQDLSRTPVVFDMASLPVVLIFAVQVFIFMLVLVGARGRSLSFFGNRSDNTARRALEESEETTALIDEKEELKRSRGHPLRSRMSQRY